MVSKTMAGTRRRVLTGGLWLVFAARALAQSPAPAAATDTPPADADRLQEVVVTGARLATRQATPTPVTQVSPEQLQLAAPNSVGDALAQLPQFSGSTVTSNLGAVSAAVGGAQALLNLRNLGANRTLVLLDGERLPTSNVNGSVDINVIPQALLSRVDVVTGGASAAYGSDAVAGVVNFVLNKHFTGVQVNASVGETTYQDARNAHVSLVAGHDFIGGRLRVEGSLDYFDQGGIGLGPNGRDWYDNPYGFVTLPKGSATTFGLIPNVAFSTMSYGGLITQLKGTNGKTVTVPGLSGEQFGPGGTLQPFDVGTNTGTAFQSGGSGPAAVNGLSPSQDREGAFLHGEFDASDHLTVFGDALYSRSFTNAQSAYAFEQTTKAFTIYPDNAYLPASVAALMRANNVASLSLGRYSADLPAIANKDITTLTRFNLGIRGSLATDWSYDASIAHGRSGQNYAQFDTLNRNLYAAADAVVNPNTGAVVCRSQLSGFDPGCVPINVLGPNSISPAGAAYVAGWDDGYTVDNQTAIEANLRGELGGPLALPAGSIALAVGVAWRQDKGTRTVSPLSNIYTSCTGLRPGGCDAYNNVYGGYQSYNPGPLQGTIDVKEGYLEFGVPLLKDLPLVKSFNVDLAGRVTDYSSSGTTYTWKIGPTWNVTDEILLRATRSQDIRAPDFNDLFSTVSSSATVTSVQYPASTSPGPASTTTTTLTVGNLNLRPEVAQTLTYGAVYRPAWVSGLSASVDYYRINLADAIAVLPTQTIVNNCYAGVQSDCALISVGGSPVTSTAGLNGAPGIVIRSAPLNVAAVRTSGLDAELAYAGRIAGGALDLRALGNYVATFSNSSAVSPNGPVYIGAYGLGATAVPRWTANFSQKYEHPLSAATSGSLALQERLISSGHYNPNYTVAQFPQGQQAVPEVTYVDLMAAVHFNLFGADTQLSLNVVNLFNKAPPAVPAASSFQSPTDFDLYDVLGRRFTLGVKAQW